MSKFVADNWNDFRPAEAAAPPAQTWTTWLVEEHLSQASEAERFDRWRTWLESHTPSEALVRDLHARGMADWLERDQYLAAAGALMGLSSNVRADPILLADTTFIEPAFQWVDASGRNDSTGTVVLSNAGEKLWASAQIEALTGLRWLSASWPRLVVEDQLPTTYRPVSPVAMVRSAAADRPRDLNRMSSSSFGEPLVVWREGLFARLQSSTATYTSTWSNLEQSLGALGSFFAAVVEDEYPELSSAWDARNLINGQTSLTLIGLDGGALTDVAAVLDDELADTGGIEGNELLAAARMSVDADLPTAAVKQVLDALGTVGQGRLDLLDSATRDLWPSDDELAGLAPWAQGHSIALHVRDVLNMHIDDVFNPHDWLASAGVEVQTLRLRTRQVDAISCWGTHRGPTILLNSDGLHVATERARRATLAHEIGHLIMDRFSALPAAEVLTRTARNSVEGRANAFAAELLLPRAYVARVFQEPSDEDEAGALIDAVSERFGVGAELVAWQARNGSWPLTPVVHRALRRRVPYKDRLAFDRAPSSRFTY